MNGFQKIRLILTLKCEHSTRIVSEGLDRELSASERWAVRLHAISCWSCRRLKRQLQFLRTAVQQRYPVGESFTTVDDQLSNEARKRISQAISQQ